MSIKLIPRSHISAGVYLIAPIMAVIMMLIAGYIIFLLLGKNPNQALHAYFIAPLLNSYSLTEIGLKSIPLILIGLGLSIGFRAGIWNIGAEGQFIMGGVAAGAVGLYFYEKTGFHILPLMFIAGALAGMAWAFIPAYLKIQFRTNEILTSLMLTYVAELFLIYMVHGPLKDPEGFNFPQSRLLTDDALLPLLFDNSRLHIGILFVVIMAVIVWFILTRTTLGLHLRLQGDAPRASRLAGFSKNNAVWFTLLFAGMAAGIAGMFEIAGPLQQLVPKISPGYGFTAIIVAFLGRLNPIGIVFGGLVLALTYIGGENAQVFAGIPSSVTGLFQGMLLFFLLAFDILTKYRIQIVQKSKGVL